MKSRGAACRYFLPAGRRPTPRSYLTDQPIRFDPRLALVNREPRRRPPMIGEDVMLSSAEADQLRQQLLQAQKLSSVGALASSVAHEFNNILTTIINYARLAQRPNLDQAARDQALEKILKG